MRHGRRDVSNWPGFPRHPSAPDSAPNSHSPSPLSTHSSFKHIVLTCTISQAAKIRVDEE